MENDTGILQVARWLFEQGLTHVAAKSSVSFAFPSGHEMEGWTIQINLYKTPESDLISEDEAGETSEI